MGYTKVVITRLGEDPIPWNRTPRKDDHRHSGRDDRDVIDPAGAILDPLLPRRRRLGHPRPGPARGLPYHLAGPGPGRSVASAAVRRSVSFGGHEVCFQVAKGRATALKTRRMGG